MSKYIEILHQVSNQLLHVVEEEQIYQILSGAVEKVLPGTFFIVSKIGSNDKNFRIIQSSGFEKYFGIIEKLIGKNPYLIDFPFVNFTELQITAFESRKIQYFSGGIHDLVEGTISKPLCKTIEKLLGIIDVYALSFCVEKKFFGGITIFTTRSTVKFGGMSEEVKMIIEIISNQASAMIQKLRKHAIIKENEVQLIELNNSKDKLFSIISHDLKSPFTSILGFTELLFDNFNDYTNEKRLQIVELLFLSTHSVYELIENLLEWSKIHQGHIVVKKEIIRLKDLINASIKPVIINAVQKDIFVENKIEHDILINVDINLLKTVIRNLFVNAVKFTNHTGHVIFDAKKIGSNTEFSISDTGIGMSGDKINSLFLFDENISTYGTDNEHGTGLGLILCKDFIHKNNGKIWVESELGKGTIFKISIPD